MSWSSAASVSWGLQPDPPASPPEARGRAGHRLADVVGLCGRLEHTQEPPASLIQGGTREVSRKRGGHEDLGPWVSKRYHTVGPFK